MPKPNRIRDEIPIVQTLERVGLLAPIRLFFDQTVPRHQADRRHEAPAAAFTFYEAAPVRCHSIPQALLWLYDDPLKGLRFQREWCGASMLVAALWSMLENTEMVPALLCVDEFSQQVIAVTGPTELMAPVQDLEAFFAMHRLHVSTYPTAELAAAWFEDDVFLDPIQGVLIDTADTGQMHHALEYWKISQTLQAPFLRALMPGGLVDEPMAPLPTGDQWHSLLWPALEPEDPSSSG